MDQDHALTLRLYANPDKCCDHLDGLVILLLALPFEAAIAGKFQAIP
jgi:hypothetical protein